MFKELFHVVPDQDIPKDFICQAGGPWIFARSVGQSSNAVCCTTFSKAGCISSSVQPSFIISSIT